MNTTLTSTPKNTESFSEPLNLLLVGNNPIELGDILDKVQRMADRKKIITEIAFDIKSLLERLVKFTPNFILIDDNIGRKSLYEAIHTLANNRKTKDIPVTVLKNSNYQESMSSTFIDYILKQNLSAELLWNSLRNSLKLRRTQLYLHKAYSHRKRQLVNALKH